MPAGSLISADYQVELRGVLMGATTIYLFDVPGIKGLAAPAPKTQDVDLEGQPGGYAANDQPAPRTITVPLIISGTDDAGAMAGLTAMNTVWGASTVDLPIVFRLPGWGTFYLIGRPRGLVEDLTNLASGVIRIQGTFYCPQPTITSGTP